MVAELATNFPANLDNLSNPSETDSLIGHAALHGNVNDALEALQSKVGVNGSTDPNSLDYKVTSVQNQVNGLDAENVSDILGLEGNNDLTISGIENKTTIDSFSSSVYRTIKYSLQITRNNEYVASEYMILNDGSNINLSESNIVSNTSNILADVTFESNAGIISLCVTPANSAITVRFVRMALKA